VGGVEAGRWFSDTALLSFTWGFWLSLSSESVFCYHNTHQVTTTGEGKRRCALFALTHTLCLSRSFSLYVFRACSLFTSLALV
jgi:hypothetical protein